MIQKTESQRIQKEINQYVLNNDQGYANLYPDKVAKFYNEVSLELGWPYPSKLAEVIQNQFSARENKDEVAILDLGCGTGLVGEELKKKGFHNLVGVDACKAMLSQAIQNKTYKQVHEISIYNKDDLSPLFDSKFDAVISSGFIGGPNHGLEPCYEAHLTCAKKNGLIAFTSSTYCRMEDFEAQRYRLQQTGQWKKISEDMIQKYQGFDSKDYKIGGKFIGKSVDVFSVYRRTK